MSDHPIQGLMKTAMENLKQMIDVNTIIGDPVETPDGSVILTVSKVGFGFAAGGSEFNASGHEEKTHTGTGAGGSSGGQKLPFGGGSGGGVSITPIAFLIVGTNGIKMLHLDESTHLYEKILDTAPQAVEKIQGIFKKNRSNSNQSQNQQQKEDFDI
ncbi:GerW family sporulation protein [Metabacillus idriensis]|uniref:Sporulation protein YtfJ n=1 Tax=Metabacillus idriensis TaxID=324768 RepID=A0A6I2MDH2_9BACI|nr:MULTISPECIES: GerW family sporulation protein [Bacillaceae]MCM3596532.1 GerW family sporulation protein [Metabacillus idriensis]MRX55384.1 sporulation protein YtfJ [Metabacillus idriensis]OHR68236.1 sporulation protein YtfJ [Bacillus sp. HMSC76G11]TDL76526.1 sporulation protein YtfJ [Peribacillus frigoritolerans]